jgi:hypothetical protein
MIDGKEFDFNMDERNIISAAFKNSIASEKENF